MPPVRRLVQMRRRSIARENRHTQPQHITRIEIGPTALQAEQAVAETEVSETASAATKIFALPTELRKPLLRGNARNVR